MSTISNFAKAALAAALVFIGLSAFSQTTETLGGYDFAIETDDEGQYYKVDCANALKGLASYVNSNNTASEKRFKQTQDITLTGTFEPLYCVFSGIYDGNNMTISGLYTERAGRIALFGYLKNATVKNVILLNPSNNALNNQDDIASLVGYALTSTIDNCKVINPTLTWKHSNPYIGVIVAECTQNSTIKDCYVYSTEYSAYGYHSNTCTIENVGSIFKISVDGCSFTSTATVITVAGTDYYPEGSEIALSHTNRDGYAFANYTANGTAIDSDTYTIANTDVEFDATWKKLLSHTDITISEISSQTYNGSALTPVVTVQDGNTTLTEGTDYTVEYSNNTDAGTSAKATITGKGNYIGTVEKTFTIVPKITVLGALTLTEDQNGIIAEIGGDYNGSDVAYSLESDIENVSVIFNRTFTAGVTSTIVLPFDIEAGGYSGGDFYEFSDIDTKTWTATMSKETSVKAHTPYLFVPSGESLTISQKVTLKAASSTTAATTAQNGWTFTGVYQKKVWNGNDGGNKDYCFAANSTSDGVNPGDFVKIGTYVQVRAFRCYLTNSTLAKSKTDLPEKITIRLIDETSSVVNPDDPDPLNPEDSGDITTPVSEITPNSGVKVWSYDGTIYIESQPDTDYTIIDLTGRTLLTSVTTSTREAVTLSRRAAGIVIVKIGQQTFKVKY